MGGIGQVYVSEKDDQSLRLKMEENVTVFIIRHETVYIKKKKRRTSNIAAKGVLPRQDNTRGIGPSKVVRYSGY